MPLAGGEDVGARSQQSGGEAPGQGQSRLRPQRGGRERGGVIRAAPGQIASCNVLKLVLPKGSLEKAALDHAWRWMKSAECQACPVRSWCRGNCHLSQTHELDCRLSREKHRVFAWLDEQENGALARNQIKVP